MIKTYEHNTKEYKALDLVASILTDESIKGYEYKVKDVYFDFGQDWKWSTIVAHDKESTSDILRSWQVLNPKEHELIVEQFNIIEALETIRTDEYFKDK